VQVTGNPAQTPPPHTSPSVHASPSLQPRLLSLNTHPLALSQLSFVQGFPSLQVTSLPWHAPPAQPSFALHALPSSQVAVFQALTQPLLAAQLSVVQGFASSQLIVAPGWHALFAQVSPAVHSDPSSHARLLASWWHPSPAVQLSVVQALLSLQSIAAPLSQTPAAHASPTLQALPSVHVPAVANATQPVVASHESVVQTLASSHSVAAPGKQAPASHASPAVHALPSSQRPAFTAC